ncbi:hypothetical protein ACF0H5_010599 [Mactra antiquata]
MYLFQILLWTCISISSTYGILAGFKGENVALNKNATQYDTYYDPGAGFNWTASLAVDGCIADKPTIVECCSGSQPTGSADPNFWQVDLGAVYAVGLLIIYGRTDLTNIGGQMNGFIVYGQTTDASGADDNVIYNNTDVPYPNDDGKFEIRVEPDRHISFIRIERPTGFLSVCEVQVYEVCDNGTYGINCTEQCGRCLNNEPCNKTSGECESGCQSGWTGAMCRNKENVAFNMTASQSSTLNNFKAVLAVDGCTNQNVDSTCCSKTEPSTENEWILNLGTMRNLAKVRVYGMLEREEELANFTVWYGDFIKQLLYSNRGQNYTDITDIDLLIPIQTNMLTIKLTNSSIGALKSLTICEVEAFEACESGYYGDDCTLACGQCLNNETCYGSSGACPNGCKPGWGGQVCKTECNGGTYGPNCESECGQCRNNTICDIMTGVCPLPDNCEPGYTGDRCDIECTNGTYGLNCSMQCGNCINNTQCTITNGTCMSCDPGYHGDMCDIECVTPSFGPDCSETCNCLNNETCNFVTGVCPGDCELGWQGQSCNTACQNFTYGINCAMECGNCLNGEECNTVNGTCMSGCAPGWLNDTCDQQCDVGKFGDECMEDCGHCLDDEVCDFRTGQCPSGCKAGWTGNTCKTECSDGAYGTNCEGRCFCINGVACNKTTGVCPGGECEIGFTGDFCHTDLNRAVNKGTNQSSTLTRDGFSWLASFAVDGNFDQSNSSSTQTCSSTDSSAGDTIQWWSVDMETVSRVDFIVVYGKAGISNELEGFNLYLTNISNIIGLEPTYNSSDTAYGDGIYVINFTANGESKLARHIYITLESTESLSLCEVRVFGECPVGTYGEQCEGTCNCADNVACNEITGICPDGCQPGWTGNQCNQGCEDGTYGIECSMTCGSCAGNITCHKSDGLCPSGCTDGWLTNWCNVTCSEGTYGANCSETCGHCKNNDTCDHVTGVCPDGCAAGFKGNLCDTVCINGTFGENCLSTCGNCINDTVCDIFTGNCDEGCKDGYVEPLCASTSAQTSDDSDNENLGAILGGIFGGLAVIIIVAVVYKLCIKRKSASSMKAADYYPSQTSSHFAASHNPGYQVTEG